MMRIAARDMNPLRKNPTNPYLMMRFVLVERLIGGVYQRLEGVLARLVIANNPSLIHGDHALSNGINDIAIVCGK